MIKYTSIEKNGGTVDGEVEIKTQPFCFSGKREVSFIDLEIVDSFKAMDESIRWHGSWNRDEEGTVETWGKEVILSSSPGDYAEVDFRGTCVYMQGNLRSDCGMIDIYILSLIHISEPTRRYASSEAGEGG